MSIYIPNTQTSQVDLSNFVTKTELSNSLLNVSKTGSTGLTGSIGIRLLCKSVKFKPQVSAAIAKALSTGISKTMEYQVTNLFTFSNLSTSNNSINQLIEVLW